MAATSDAMWRKLCGLLELPELAELDPPERAYDDRDEVYRMIAARLVERPTKEWLDVLATRDVWAAPVQDFDDLVHDPQVDHNALLTTVPHPGGGDVRVVAVPMRFSETPGTVRSGPPAVGAHTDDVLAEAGYSEEDIAALHREGCV
jgi:crotonobetainyl-CoA:carnitine CoA-transferase CaiB-like acyl-CoA transferase